LQYDEYVADVHLGLECGIQANAECSSFTLVDSGSPNPNESSERLLSLCNSKLLEESLQMLFRH